MQTLIATFNNTIDVMKFNMPFVLMFLALLWGIQLVNFLLQYRLNVLGIYPRRVFGLVGIPCSPFLHGSATHLFFNSIPLFLLSSLVLAFGQAVFYEVSTIIIVLGGLLVWIFGRPGFHVGASGLIMGYLGFLLTQAYFSQSAFGLILGILGFYYCGSLLLHLLPLEVRSSWEGHVFGFLAGAFSYWMLSQNISIIEFF